jgi:hypothetical protein
VLKPTSSKQFPASSSRAPMIQRTATFDLLICSGSARSRILVAVTFQLLVGTVKGYSVWSAYS